MGCDIHTITEIKRNDAWERISEVPEVFDTRNYTTFAFLADVRNSFETEGFQPKGLPEDISAMKFDYDAEDDFWEVDFECEDYHSHSHLTLKELIEKDKTSYCSHKCKISKHFYEKFIELGGVIPEGMKVKTEIEHGDFIDALRYAYDPTVIVAWNPSEEEAQEYPIFKGIRALEEIAEKYGIENPENIRIVFAFDN